MSSWRSRSGGIGDREDRQPEVQVLAILTRRDRGLEVAVRRRHDADVHLQRHGAADAFEALLLQRAQDLRLQRQRQVADFVEEQRAAVRELELARLPRRRAGERALLVTEELGLEQRLGNRGAVDGDERSVGARAQHVQRAREQLLARAALAFDQHGRVGRRRAMQRQRHLFQLGVLADDGRGAATGGEFLLEENVLHRHAALRRGTLDHQQQMIRIDWLREEIEGAFFHRGDRVLNAAECGHDDHRQLRIELLGGTQDAEAVAIGQAKVGQDDAGPGFTERLDGFRLIARFDDGVALRFERMPQHGAKRVLVLHQEDRRRGRTAH